MLKRSAEKSKTYIEMSFIPAVRREIANRDFDDPVRLTLEFLLENAVGRVNSVPIRRILEHLESNEIVMSPNGFQQSILAESRRSDFFIGSGNRGMFLIDSEGDAARMRDFYRNRISAEQANLDNLVNTARDIGWQL